MSATADAASASPRYRRIIPRTPRSFLPPHGVYEYIGNNPVRAGMSDAPEDWPWTGSV